MERNCLPRHMSLWRSLKATSPLRAQRERYGPGDALAGAIRSRVYRAPPGDEFFADIDTDHAIPELSL